MPELVHSELPDVTQRRLIRIMTDVAALGQGLTLAQTKSAYCEIEAARDGLSRLLDRADGKHA